MSAWLHSIRSLCSVRGQEIGSSDFDRFTPRDWRKGSQINREIQRIRIVAVQDKKSNLSSIGIMDRGPDDPIDCPGRFRFQLGRLNLRLQDLALCVLGD